MFKLCVIVPVYNHPQHIQALVEFVRERQLPVILINDGSNTACTSVLRQIDAAQSDVTLLEHASNQGKGQAVQTGLRHASVQGYSHALQIDADGQHHWPDIDTFIATSQQHPAAVVIGAPQYDDSVPRQRLYARYATHIWVWINSLSFAIKDSMCGFRVYPLAASMAALDSAKLEPRMGFDTEILVRLHWRATPVINIPTPVTYPADGSSHFQPWRDNWGISKVHTRLFFGMLARAPQLLWRKLASIGRG